MKSLLIIGPDGTLRDVHAMAVQIHPNLRVEMRHIPSEDYYHFDLSGMVDFPPEEWDVCVAVNEFYINDVRRALHSLIASLGYCGITLISPQAYVDASVIVGENTIIHAGCFVGYGTSIGHHSVLRPNVVIAEEVSIGDYVTLEANVSIREKSKVGNFTIICANSSLARMTDVGAHCYLNLSRQYIGRIASGTFYSPSFENPIRIFSS